MYYCQVYARTRLLTLCFTVGIIFVLTPMWAFAENELLEFDSAVVSAETTEKSAETESLRSISSLLESQRQEYRRVQQKLLDPEQSTGREEQLRAELFSLQESIDSLEGDLSEMVTTVSNNQFFFRTDRGERSLLDEVQSLLTPLFDEAKRLTSRPRQISQLRQSVEQRTWQREWAERAIRNIDSTLQSVDEGSVLHQELVELRATWETRLQSVHASLAVAEQQLRNLTAGKKTLGEQATELFDLFFKSRGRNLLLALLAALAFSFLLRAIYRRMELHYQESRRLKPLVRRLMNVSYLVAQFLGVFLVFLGALFVIGDWILLILGVTVLIGLLWASKHAIPRMGTNFALMLNVGPSREGERLIYNGVPFLVRSIGFQSFLTNPELNPSTLRLPVADLSGLRSRVITEDEPWFPTKRGDWILFNDERLAQVIEQSVERVVIAFKGGAQKSFGTEEFLVISFTNLSRGYRIHDTFGLDYALQSTITSLVPETLRTFVSKGLTKEFDPGKWKLTIEFRSAGDSSLDLSVILDCDAELATAYELLRRRLQALCVDCATENGWEIPFPQVTLSKRETSSPEAA